MKDATRVLSAIAAIFCLMMLSGCMGSEQSAEETKSKYEQGAKDPAGDGR